MPAMLAARLYRVLPLLAILAIIGIVVYIFMSWRYTPARAKEAVIKIFIALNGGLSILFALATLYAWIESNAFVADFFITCLATTLIMLGITFICRRNFSDSPKLKTYIVLQIYQTCLFKHTSDCFLFTEISKAAAFKPIVAHVSRAAAAAIKNLPFSIKLR